MSENQQVDIQFKLAKELIDIHRQEMKPVRKISLAIDILSIGFGYLLLKKIVKKEVDRNVIQKEKTR